MPRAFEVPKNDSEDTNRGRIMMCIEGPRDLVDFADFRLRENFTSGLVEEEGSREGEIALFFVIGRDEKPYFMDKWKEAKAAFPKSRPPKARQVAEAAAKLCEAEQTLQRAIDITKSPARLERSAKYLRKRVSSLRGGVRRAHRALCITEKESQELLAVFEDVSCTRPRQLVAVPVTYTDHKGSTVSREKCLTSAVQHWATIVKAHRLAITIGDATPDYARGMLNKFGSLDIYLSFKGVGQTSAIRLPVVEHALQLVKELPAQPGGAQLEITQALVRHSVSELVSWMEMTNAMFHYDIIQIVDQITAAGRAYAEQREAALKSLTTIRDRLTPQEPIQIKARASSPLVISTCSPEEAA
ncbi:hypothetical protein [Pantoea sp. CCBC3-3-1]|uniref:hypothetical protein n=1 Tax=Pantoea sp. CCBC3-3-1 TaxID=2490851 RepID=UPI0011BDCB4A|nr:hypothetical protein [Pantoea sp. CCBC3-3-1]